MRSAVFTPVCVRNPQICVMWSDTPFRHENRKKYDLQKKQLKDTDKREKYKVYGELIHTYGYQLEEGCKGFDALNYYTNETIHIPLDATISPLDNAKKYFDRYAKLKRTYEALTDLIEDTQLEIDHLDSIATALDIAETQKLTCSRSRKK